MLGDRTTYMSMFPRENLSQIDSIPCYGLWRDTEPGVMCHPDVLVIFGEDKISLLPISIISLVLAS